MIRFVLSIVCVCLLCTSGKAEDLLVTLSERTVDITSNFTGSAITVFGAVLRDAATVPRASDYDVVVTVTGPTVDAITRRKDRVLGVWINREAETFENVPSAYSVLSNRPVQEIAHPNLLRRFQIGIEHLLVAAQNDDEEGTDDQAEGLGSVISAASREGVFGRAFLRLQTENEIYAARPEAVEIINNQLFRARATFPADVPLGNFTVRVFLFSGGVLLAEDEVAILVRKTGFEQFIFSASQGQPVVYGLLAVVLALFTGWLGGVVFRRS
ncbi:MAG: TIGR02186 family protein [Pseudomonadota bacterium]